MPRRSCRKPGERHQVAPPSVEELAARGTPGRARRATGGRRARRSATRRGVLLVGRQRARARAHARRARARPRTTPATTSRTRLRPASRPGAASSSPRVDGRGRLCEHAPGAVQPGVDRAEVHQRAPGRLARAGAAHHAPRDATAPPNQTAATPMPPHAKPGRSRYHPGAPTASRRPRRTRRGPESTSVSPRATHVPATAVTPGSSQVDGEQLRAPPPTRRADQGVVEHAGRASTTACARRGRYRRPSSSPAAARPAPRRRTRPTCGRPAGPRPPARGCRASRCGSSTRATVRSAAATLARADHRNAVLPLPGCGSRPPTSRARPSAAGTSPAAAWPARTAR